MCFHSIINDRNEFTTKQNAPNSSTVEEYVEKSKNKNTESENILKRWTDKWTHRNENTASPIDSKSTDLINKFKRIFKS